MKRLIGKVVGKIGTALDMAFLQLMTLWRNSPSLLDGEGVVVSLTTYGRRAKFVHLTIESIALGDRRPSRMILWLDPEQFARPPRALRRLQRRGLELREAPAEWGPHKKYFPYCTEFADDGAWLVTADDDVIYPHWWLLALTEAVAKEPDVIWAHRVRRVALDGDGLAPYADWEYGRDVGPSTGNVSIGVDGVYFPPRFQQVMRDAGTGFMEHAARADDLWLHVHAVRADIQVGQVGGIPGHYPSLIGTQGSALANRNQVGGGNDAVASALYRPADVAALRRALTPQL